jgi:hypothetical protein
LVRADVRGARVSIGSAAREIRLAEVGDPVFVAVCALSGMNGARVDDPVCVTVRGEPDGNQARIDDSVSITVGTRVGEDLARVGDPVTIAVRLAEVREAISFTVVQSR